MDLEALNTFVTVVEEKSFTRASQKLMLSQPTVSFHIKSLETFFHTNLIDRSPKRFHLTHTGEMVYERAKQIHGIIERAKSDIADYHQQLRGSLHIGASYTVGEYVLPGIMKAFSSLHPDIHMEVTIDNTEQVNRGVLLHDVDIGLVEGQVNFKELQTVPFLQDELVVIVPEDHPLYAKQTLEFKDVQDQTWISRESGSGTRALMDSMFEAYNIRPSRTMTIGSNHGVVQGVKQGLGLSFISKTVVENTFADYLIRDVTFMNPAKRFFSYVLTADGNHSKNADVFVEIIRTLYHFDNLT
ncbi:LysR family transcriptional regulator [Thalassobacillus sp. CUG 92003]|uniref:LysR family transcriptional regulator n=1 Tax=Thalassobacillus sp. CUG 92003 TaxID=2736641 RepID=UPI0015E6C9E8|nr:LysR family transcriptional regulator [Thalassobacillus sp. CUG 92003]